MARHGGIGIIHRFNSVEEQVEMVEKVKRAESYRIDFPYTCGPELPVSELRQLMQEKEVGSFLVTDKTHGPRDKLIGLVSTRDLLFVPKGVCWFVFECVLFVCCLFFLFLFLFFLDSKLVVKDVMTPREKLIVGNPDTSLDQARDVLQKNKLEKLPLIDTQGNCAGLITGKGKFLRKKNFHLIFFFFFLI